MSSRPLEGVRVLDLSRVLAGPWATQMLADFGAEVIKIEKPGSGDETRAWGPPFLTGADGSSVAAYFLVANRGKQSVAIDISRPEGQQLVRELAAASDVVVENFKVGALARYGLDYASLRAINPGIVYCSLTGFGQDGPYADRPGYDFIIQGMSGLMSVTGQPESAGGAPMKVGVALVDIITGLNASNAIMAALRHRDQTGIGQRIDVALLDSAIAAMANQALNYLAGGADSRRLGNAHPNIVPYESFPTADQEITIAVGNDAQFRRLCLVLGMPEVGDDPRFVSNTDRVNHREALIPLLVDRLMTRPAAEWLAAFNEAGIPAGAINTMAQAFADPQVRHRKLEIALSHDRLGTMPGVASPIRFSETPVAYDRPPPLLGEHSRAVLRDLLGKSDADLAELARLGVID